MPTSSRFTLLYKNILYLQGELKNLPIAQFFDSPCKISTVLLFVSGHSLGAGVAVLLTLDLLMNEDRSELREKIKDVQCYAFAPPPVFRPKSSWILGTAEVPVEVKEKMILVVNDQDCIPRTSLG